MKIIFRMPWLNDLLTIIDNYEGFLNKGEFITLRGVEYKVMSVEVVGDSLLVRLK